MNLRVDMRLAPVSGSATSADLIAFATYCADRIARDLEGVDGWQLYLDGGLDGQAAAIVRVRAGARTLETRANACDPAVAIWDAMCKVEQPLRDALAA